MAFWNGFHSILQERRKARSAHVTEWACGTRTGPGLALGPRLQQTSSLCMAAPKNILKRASGSLSENTDFGHLGAHNYLELSDRHWADPKSHSQTGSGAGALSK